MHSVFLKINGAKKQVNTVNIKKMKINNITFGDYTRTVANKNNTVTEYYNNSGILYRSVIIDDLGRDIDSKEFNSFGIIISHQHKKYYKTLTENGFIETFKNSLQQYIRKSCTKFENGFRHTIDDFKSHTNPDKSYVNEFIYGINNKLINIINYKYK